MRHDNDNSGAVFVSRRTAAERLEISPDTFDQWVRSGYVPQPNISRGQIIRWHWPSVEAKLADRQSAAEADVFKLPDGPYVRERRRK